MPRYLKQTIETDCGPVAAMNALKWAGKKITFRKHHKNIRKECDWCVVGNKGCGTYATDIVKVLRKRGNVKVRTVFSPTLQQLENHLLNGGSFILRYSVSWGPNNKNVAGHFAFCDKLTPAKNFVFYNSPYQVSKRTRTRKMLSFLVKHKQAENGFSRALLISKKD